MREAHHRLPAPAGPAGYALLWDPSYTMEQHVADLKEEAHILMELGFDGAVFANEADYPYVEHIGEGALAAYTRIVTEVSRELTFPSA